MLEYDRMLSVRIHRENVIYFSIIILFLKILIIKDIHAMGVMICL